MKIVVGYDGSADADGALRDLDLAGLPPKANVLIVSIAPAFTLHSAEGQGLSGLSKPLSVFWDDARKHARMLSENAAASMRERFPEWKVKAEADILDPAIGLLEKAEKYRADLIVVGSHGRSALSRFFLGSVSQRVLNHSGTDVRITRPGLRSRRRPPRLLIGMDGSRSAAAAVDAVIARNWPKGTEVRVLGVLDYKGIPGEGFFGAFRHSDEAKRLRRAWLERKASLASDALAKAGLSATASVAAGDPRTVLIKEAKSWVADSIFLGARGLGTVERFFLGSVSTSVAAHAPCSVEIIRKYRRRSRKR